MTAILTVIVIWASLQRGADETNVWLVVAASTPSPAGIARAAKGLAAKGLRPFIFQTGDCGEKRNIFGAAIEISGTVEAARVAFGRATRAASNVYLKRCAVVPRSLLAHRFPVVDSSIANVPGDAVNWDDSDRVSTVVNLADGRDLIASRHYVEDPEDSLEGRRVRLLLPSGSGESKVLSDDCAQPAGFQERSGVLAFQCAGEEAGDQLLHTVLVFDADGALLARAERCRNPVLSDGVAVTCKGESVDAKGRLKLRSKRVPFAESRLPARRPRPDGHRRISK